MAVELSFAECRVLGVLIEKGLTTPDQYPLTLNSVLSGCNQKSCRDPVSSLPEEDVLESLESLREKGLVTLVRTVGSRTDRFKHRAGETLGIEGKEAAVLAELLLRGPQTDGELRQRASRMVQIDTLAELANVIDRLRTRDRPLVRRLGAEGRRRGVKYTHTMGAEEDETLNEDDYALARSPHDNGPAHRTERAPAAAAPSATPAPSSLGSTAPIALRSSLPIREDGAPRQASDAMGARVQFLEETVGKLTERVKELEDTFARFFQ